MNLRDVASRESDSYCWEPKFDPKFIPAFILLKWSFFFKFIREIARDWFPCVIIYSKKFFDESSRVFNCLAKRTHTYSRAPGRVPSRIDRTTSSASLKVTSALFKLILELNKLVRQKKEERIAMNKCELDHGLVHN